MNKDSLYRYGGYVTGIDFNFQGGAQPSTASVSITSEDGTYTRPACGERFTMPFGLGFSMTITKTKIELTGKSRLLRVELVDNTAESLDMNLVLVRGEHTSGLAESDTKLQVPLAKLYSLLEMPKDAWPRYIYNSGEDKDTFFHQAARAPKKLTPNVWIIGGGKSIFSPTNTIVYPVARDEGGIEYKYFDPKEEKDFFLTYKDKEFQEEISETSGETVIGKEIIIRNNASDVSLKFGYTAQEFKALLQNFIKVTDVGGLLDNDYILFNNAGTVRECLASIASKLGFLFYYDVTKTRENEGTGGLIVLGNEKITNINRNINELEEGIGGDAISMSSTESIEGLEAKHVLVKGEISERQFTRSGGYSGYNNVGQRMKFKRVPLDKLFAGSEKVKQASLDNFYSLFLSSAKNDNRLFNDFVYAYHMRSFKAPEDEVSKIGTIYGDAECAFTDPITYKPTGSVDPTTEEGAETVVARGIIGPKVFFPLRKIVAGGEGKKPNISPPTEPASSGLYKILEMFYKFAYNVYISPAVAGFKAGEISFDAPGFKIHEEPLEPKTKVKDIPVFKDLLTALDDYNVLVELFAETTVKQIAQWSGMDTVNFENADPVGSRMFFIAVRTEESMVAARTKADQEQNEKIGAEIDVLIAKHIGSTIDGNAMKLICSEKYEELIAFVKTKSEKLHKEFRGNVEKEVMLLWNRKNNSGDTNFDNEFDESSILKPNRYSFNHIPDPRHSLKQGKVSKVSLVYINGPKKETDLFLDNISKGQEDYSLVPTFKGPIKSLQVKYNRPPNADDFDPEKGVDTMSVSIGSDSISTSISYSAKKYFAIGQDVVINDDLIARNLSALTPFSARQKSFMNL